MGRNLAPLVGLACAVAVTVPARAETLDLPPGAIVIRDGAVIFPSASASATRPSAPVAPPEAPNRSPLGLELPPGARVIYSGPAPPPWLAGAAAAQTAPGVQASGPATPSADVAEAITASAARHGLSRPLVEAVAWQESRFDNSRVSPKGARGVMQLMPGTASQMRVDERDLRSNIDGGAAYLALLLRRFSGDLALALAAYNAGPEAVERHRGIPPYAETRAYVEAILARLGR